MEGVTNHCGVSHLERLSESEVMFLTSYSPHKTILILQAYILFSETEWKLARSGWFIRGQLPTPIQASNSLSSIKFNWKLFWCHKPPAVVCFYAPSTKQNVLGNIEQAQILMALLLYSNISRYSHQQSVYYPRLISHGSQPGGCHSIGSSGRFWQWSLLWIDTSKWSLRLGCSSKRVRLFPQSHSSKKEHKLNTIIVHYCM